MDLNDIDEPPKRRRGRVAHVPEPVLPTETEVMLKEERYDDYCQLCVAILEALRTGPVKGLSAEQMHHLHNKLWIKKWFTADHEFQERYRSKYPLMFTSGPPTTIPWQT